MGMFDYIEHETDCESCGEALMDFQSKDSECLLKELEPKEVNSFYSWCNNCNKMKYFQVIKSQGIHVIRPRGTTDEGK